MATWPVEVERILSRCRFFSNSRLWPMNARIHPERWLQNFKADELRHAASLLESFMYVSPEMVNAMLTAVFQSLATELIDPVADAANFRSEWTNFIEGGIFTHVAGEKPNASDSGHLFVRKLRQELGVPERRLFYHPEAIAELRRADGYLVFVDDFVGSGQQFIHTWHAPVRLDTGEVVTFASVANPSRVLYCPLITTSLGLREIARHTSPEIRVVPAHVLTPEYGVAHPQSVVWSDDLLPDATDFIDIASNRAGIEPDERLGFAGLGLALGFDHSVPDATVRMIYWEENGWNPLLVRR